ncbi:MAG: hypothetical protein MI974_32965 [Chitinophagales bacterium]|nr:hypothetical protein [Chitinophagales bacterium]
MDNEVFCTAADKLIERKLTISQLHKIAEEAIKGKDRSVLGFKKAVIVPSYSDVEERIRVLTDYIISYSPNDPEKWAGILVMTVALLVDGNYDLVRRRTIQAFEMGASSCPENAKWIAIETVEEVLNKVPNLSESELSILNNARNIFLK